MADDEGAANRQEQFDHGEENGRRDGEEVREEEDGDGAEDSSPDDSDGLSEEEALLPVTNEESDDDSLESDDVDDLQGESFDTDLPTRHSYLGQSSEVSGRTILEEDLIQELVVVSHPGVILVPGQTMPLTIFRPNQISLMKTLINSVKTFGSLYVKYDGPEGGMYEEAKVGTTAEIYEYRDPSEESDEVGLKLKVKGRQRFRVVSSRRQIDGTQIATVEILREVKLPEPLFDLRLRSRDRFRCPFDAPAEDPPASEEAAAEIKGTRKHSESLKDSFAEFMSHLRRKKPSQLPENKEEFSPKYRRFKNSRQNYLRTSVYAAPLTPYPNWVFEMYDAKILVERIHELLGSLRLFSQTRVSVPSDPEELSFWIASNIPMDDRHRLQLLETNCAVQRLRYELHLLKKCQVLCCKHCNEEIATQDDIFSMSQEGPQSAYVNPGGYVHETLTIYRARGLNLDGSPSVEYSWFPGYAWTIAQCRRCNSHMGWKFTAASNRRLVPKKFWGISRRSVKPLLGKAERGHSKKTDEENLLF